MNVICTFTFIDANNKIDSKDLNLFFFVKPDFRKKQDKTSNLKNKN